MGAVGKVEVKDGSGRVGGGGRGWEMERDGGRWREVVGVGEGW